jgi:hypothetical protein
MKLHLVLLSLKRVTLQFLKWFLITLIAGFIVLTFIVISYTVIELINLELDYSVKSYHTFIKIIDSGIGVLGITIALASIFLIFRQISLAVKGNKVKPMEDWKTSREVELQKLIMTPIIYNHFSKNLTEMFDFLYELDKPFKINRNRELTNFFKKFLNDKIESFELNSREFLKDSGYKTIQPYSINDVKKITEHILIPSSHYSDFYDDFNKLYLDVVEKMIIKRELIIQ